MLPSTFYSDTIHAIKSANSCVDLCRFSLGLPIHYEGQAIHAPSFIRSGDSHPSFAVYHNNAYDFSSGKSYDIFDLLMLAKGLTFAQAFQEISGSPLSSFIPQSTQDRDLFADNLNKLQASVKDWHKALLDTPKALEFLKSRGITQDTIVKFFLGYDARADRIIIPFFRNGKIVYYAGRDLSGRNNPKYLYPATDYGITKIPFGLHSLKPAFKKKNLKPHADLDGSSQLEHLKSSTLILTEGILDALSLIQDGWQALASGGGSFGRNNQQTVLDFARMYDNVLLAYDNDPAGQNFQLKIARWLLGEQIPFTCAQIPHSFDGHSVKDINDFYCAGGSWLDVVQGAETGISFVGGKLNTLQEVYSFVKDLAGYATAWDLQCLFDKLAGRTKGSLAGDPDPENLETMDSTPLFRKSELRATFKSAGSKPTDKEIIRRVLKRHEIVFSTDGKFYEFNHKYWEQITKETVKRYISQVLGERATEGRCGAVMALMKVELEDDTPFNAQHVVTFRNGVLLLDEPDPEKRFVPHSPDFRCTFMEDFAFPTTFKPKAKYDSYWKQTSITGDDDGEYYKALHNSCWWKFLSSIFPKTSVIPDHALIREVQKMCGYIYFTDNRFEKTFMLLGKGGNGKSTFMQIIEEVVGTEFCTHLRPNRLASSFDPIVLRNSILNVCHEASKDLEGAEETLKAVTSGNPIMASYKGQDTISFKPRAKWFISANSPMDVKDVSYGFTRRMIFIPFTAKFKDGQEDPEMLDKLRKEKALIFSWMYEGYLMLKCGERFKKTPEQLAKKAEVQEYVDHTLTFVREYFVEGDYVDCMDSMPGSSERIPLRKLPNDRTMYKWYLKWCKETNTEPLPRYEAIGRINEAISVKCPDMKIIRGIEVATGRERDIYVSPDLVQSVESINIYDIDTQDAIEEAVRSALAKAANKKQITSAATGIPSSTPSSATETPLKVLPKSEECTGTAEDTNYPQRSPESGS